MPSRSSAAWGRPSIAWLDSSKNRGPWTSASSVTRCQFRSPLVLHFPRPGERVRTQALWTNAWFSVPALPLRRPHSVGRSGSSGRVW